MEAGGARVLDASAAVAVVEGERGAERVMAAIGGAGAVMSAVNLSEALAVMIRHGMPEEMAHRALGRLGLHLRVFDAEDAHLAARLQPQCPRLSFGDRACLALAQRLGLPAVTADSAWRNGPPGVRVELIR